MSCFYYMSIFQTNIIEIKEINVNVSNRINFKITNKSVSYKVPVQQCQIYSKDENSIINQEVDFKLVKNKTHIIITARTKQKDPNIAKVECNDEINSVISMISVLYTPDLFNKCIYSGWVNRFNEIVMDSWIKIVGKVKIEESYVLNELQEMKLKISSNKDLQNRYKLMSKFFSKALLYVPGEVRFLLLWTVLEIYPMKDTSNIKPISFVLGKILEMDPKTVKEKLKIGILFDYRCNIVHNGCLNIDIKLLVETISKLEKIVLEVLRNICGLSYSGSLDNYLK